mgnify:FL=1
MSRIAREYGWDPRVFPLLMATGLTKEDCDIIAASICQGRRLFAESVMRTVWPDAPRFESSMLMAYTVLREPASEALAAVSPDKIRIAALEHDLHERDLHIADLEASLAECHKTIDSLIERLPQGTASPAAAKPKSKEDKEDAEGLSFTEEELQQAFAEEDAMMRQMGAQSKGRQILRSYKLNDAQADDVVRRIGNCRITKDIAVECEALVNEGVINQQTAVSKQWATAMGFLQTYSPRLSVNTIRNAIRKHFDCLT